MQQEPTNWAKAKNTRLTALIRYWLREFEQTSVTEVKVGDLCQED